jgi:hypothetical protein
MLSTASALLRAGKPMDEQILAQMVVELVHETVCDSCIVWAKSDRLVQQVKVHSPGQQVGALCRAAWLAGWLAGWGWLGLAGWLAGCCLVPCCMQGVAERGSGTTAWHLHGPCAWALATWLCFAGCWLPLLEGGASVHTASIKTRCLAARWARCVCCHPGDSPPTPSPRRCCCCPAAPGGLRGDEPNERGAHGRHG